MTTEEAGGVLTITLFRPEAKNAMTHSAAEQIAAAVDELDRREDLVVGIITGGGGTFCSGMDLKDFVRGSLPVVPGRGFAGVTERPPSKPFIAAVEGWALAGGCELALAADIVVAARTARFGLPEVKRGLVAAAGGLLRLPSAVGYSRAMLMALTGDPVTAEDAARDGLVTVLTQEGQALPEAMSIAQRIAGNGPLAVRATKQVMAARLGIDSAAFRAQRVITDPVITSRDATEGARAFAEKRAPAWSAR
ncbi:crotonase/enoyl-CoA hydratase family protein [Nocardia fusca]|uniref:crotonase/enoyl-CoA hydratase family protein n=1 Tax=Nocardia fusca TaxID=941183 RepID=UPI0018DDBE2A|nr:crotonase/enoyl-CoA hydratase family protein [Nocardia fusca]